MRVRQRRLRSAARVVPLTSVLESLHAFAKWHEVVPHRGIAMLARRAQYLLADAGTVAAAFRATESDTLVGDRSFRACTGSIT